MPGIEPGSPGFWRLIKVRKMAFRSDFAQKLLNDLRIRKERMGVSQGSMSSTRNATTRDARNPGNMQRGSRQTKSLESIGGSKTMNQSIKESSQQLVPYAGGQHQRSESLKDLSMAFTYALKNGGNTNTMIDFLQQIGRRSLNVESTRTGTMTTSLVKHRPSNGGGTIAPVLTTIQIKEISKGVQNLYEIIRSNSNGAHVDRYSVEVGKELLKGAKGLEESLKMLVNLQEASELMVTTQRKSRVTLREVVDEDDENDEDRSKVVDRNQVQLPRFSFDKRSKKSSLALTDGSSKSSSHRRSASCGAESVTTMKDSPNRSEKGRISNVIAKLMGLEEVQEKPDSGTKRDEVKTAHVSSANKVYKTSRTEKHGLVSLNVQKSQQINDSSTSVSSKTRQNNNNNNRLDRVAEKQKRQTNVETKHKTQQKRTNAEGAASLRVDKKRTIRKDESNEIKLITRNYKVEGKEKRTQQNKQDSQQIKQVKHTNLFSKEPKPQPIEHIPKTKDVTPKVHELERTERYMQPLVKQEKPVTRNKVDSVAIRRTESPRIRDEVLKIRDRTVISNLTTPSKHKLSVLKETIRKDVSSILLKPAEETNNIHSNSNESEQTIRFNYSRFHNTVTDQVPVYENTIQSDRQLTSEITVSGPPKVILKPANLVENKPTSNLVEHKSTSEVMVSGPQEIAIKSVSLHVNKPKKTFYLNKQVVLNDHEKQLKEILIKDQLFLSTSQALFKLNIPIGFLHADDQNHHKDETTLKLDCGYEILKRKARNQELSLHPYVKPSIGAMAISLLDELVKELYKDLESLRLYGRNTRNEYDEADYLHYMLEKDICNTSPDVNSFWDFGWNITTFTFLEKDEFVNDVEAFVLRILVDEIVNDLLTMSLPFWSK
ncbi:uncharacterized protein [Rutidosis leptorrhynchoides]|uniref:uncharacterized protein n=1 Tax=Rutidosis leptorrhynchoides TaxID=125765 RepID=UPI003A98E108